MTSTTTGPDEQRLSEALEREADRLVVDDQGLARIQARLGSPGSTAVGPAPRARRLRRGLLTGAGAIGVAAAVSLVVSIGLRPDATPQPVETPGPPPAVSTGYEPSPGRRTVDIYRVRSTPSAERPRLAVETVGVTPPFQPRQALDALFGLPALNRADDSVLDDGLNVVASTTETEDALVLDMAEVDELSSPPSRAVAEVWVQAWVRTLQSAYRSDKGVLITVGGRPTTLYGVVDTSRPIGSADAPTTQDQAIFVPRPGQAVTSPVSFGANLPAGDFVWRVTGEDGRRFGEEFSSEGDGGYGGPVVDLPPGRFRAVVASGPDSVTQGFRRSVEFEVTGDEPGAGAPPVTDPPTTPLDTVAVYFAGAKGRGLVEERRTRRDPVAVLQDYLALPPTWPTPEVSGLRRGNEVAGVTAGPDRVVVDFAVLAPVGPDVAGAELRRQAAAFVRTVQSVTGRDLPVQVTVGGEPAAFLGQRSLTDLPVPTEVETADDSTYPQAPRVPGRAEIVGSSRPGSSATYSLDDAVTERTVAQGRVPVGPDGGYAFSIEVPAGRYLLSLDSTSATGDSAVHVVDVTVS